ncbi:MAG: hypothetical protein NT009_11765 [Proteobacteria bacterium]|nr:hypothetical protein [Pseudomonadota bacterium]
MKYRKDLFYLFLLLGFGIVFWWGALAPGQVFFLRDISSEIIAKRHFWAMSNGFTLWSPYSFFGIPYAANPQSEAFYPFNFLFLIFGAERGVVYYLVFHHLFFLLTFYLALRQIGFKEEAALIGSVGFGFGGYLISFTHIPLFFSTVTWLGLIIICLHEALGRRWLIWSLLLGLVIAVQILGGAIEAAGMCWVLAFCTVAFATPRKVGPRDLAKMLGVMIFGLIWGIILSLPQIAIALELVPISNRAEGMRLTEVLNWSLPLSGLKSFLIPNYLLPLSAGIYWGLGFFSGYSYLFSYYLGVTLLLLMFFSFAGPTKRKALFWLVLTLFGLIMMLGDNLGVYELFCKYLPGFNLFRIPVKFFFFLNFGFVLLAIFGYEYLSGGKYERSFSWGSLVCLFAAVTIFILLLLNPLKVQELGDNYSAISTYLFWRSILRVSVFFLIMLGLVFLAGRMNRDRLGPLFAVVIFLDLLFAHHLLNPSTTKDFFRPNSFIRELWIKEKNGLLHRAYFPFHPRNRI